MGTSRCSPIRVRHLHTSIGEPPETLGDPTRRRRQQTRIGRILHVSLDHRRVSAHLFRTDLTTLMCSRQQLDVQRLDQLRTTPPSDLADRRRIRHRRLQPDPTEPSPRQRIGHRRAPPFVAEVEPVLQEHQPQIRLHRDRRTTLSLIEELPERPEISTVVQQPVDLGQLTRQHPHPRRQPQLEQRTLRSYNSQHGGPHP